MPATYGAIETTLSPARLKRYLPAADFDKHLALRLYVWNARICEALYLPLQLAEVAVRNAISMPVRKRFGDQWFINPRFCNLLPARHKNNLNSTVLKEATLLRPNPHQDNVVAGLEFGFWVSLMTSRFQNHIWINGIGQSFPGAQNSETRTTIHQKLDKMRRFRNLVAHHHAIFDRAPQPEIQNALHITKLVCADTHWLANETSRLSTVINQRPRN